MKVTKAQYNMAQKSEHDRLIFYDALNPMLYVNFRCEIDL